MKSYTSNKGIDSKLVIVFLTIILSTSSLIIVTRMSMEAFFVLLSVWTIFIYAIQQKKVEAKYILLNSLLSIIVIVSMLFNQDFSVINFAFILLPWYGWTVFLLMDKEMFAYHYCNCMTFLAIYSLIAHYVLLFMFPGLVDLFPIGQNSGGYDVHDFILAFRYVSIVSKNTGLFREMGVYAVYLNFALYFILFEVKNIKYKLPKTAILFVTILSTLSTPGIIAAGMIVFAKGIEILHGKKVTKWIRVTQIAVFALVVVVLALIFLPIVFDYLKSSMDKLTKGGSSFHGRIGSMVAYLRVWLHSPVLGVGYANSVSQAANYYDYSEILHNTSSNASLLAMYGIFYWIILYRKIIKNIARKKQFICSKLIVVVALLMLMECQYLILDSLWWVFMWYFIHDRKGQEIERCM